MKRLILTLLFLTLSISSNSLLAKSKVKTFTKHGNNGSVSCNEFCAGSQWGDVGSCVSALDNLKKAAVKCDTVTGLINGKELTCECTAEKPSTKAKPAK